MIHTVNDRSMLSSITTLKDRLADIIEPDFGLLDELLRLEVLSRREYNKIRSGNKAAYERSDAVLDLLTTEDQCDKFLKALQRTGQQHIVNFVTQNGGQTCNYRPNAFLGNFLVDTRLHYGSIFVVSIFDVTVKNAACDYYSLPVYQSQAIGLHDCVRI